MIPIRGIQLNDNVPLNVLSHSIQVVNPTINQNNPQFLSSQSHCDKDEVSRQIAINIYSPTDKLIFNNSSLLSDIKIYYEALIISKNMDSMDYDFEIVFKIILVFLGIDLPGTRSSSESYCSQSNTVTFKIPPKGYDFYLLTQADKFVIGSAVKSRAKELKRKKKEHNRNRRTGDTEYEFVEVSVRDKQGRYSKKTDIILNKPELVCLSPAHNPVINPVINPDNPIINPNNPLNSTINIEDTEVVIRRNISGVEHFAEIVDSCDLVHYDMLYYTTNLPVKILPWNGSHLGNFDKSEFEIVKTQVTMGNKYILLNIKGEQFWAEYIKATDEQNCSLICTIDEWKPLFGLDKIGTHSITLDKKNYILFMTANPSKIFSISKKLSAVNPKMVNGDNLDQIRKILLFKYLIGCPLNLRGGGNFIRYDVETRKFTSHLDTDASATHSISDFPKNLINKWLTDTLENGVVDRDQYLIILSKYLKIILNINEEDDKEIKPILLRSAMEDIGRSVNSKGESNYCIKFIISRVQSLIDY